LETFEPCFSNPWKNGVSFFQTLEPSRRVGIFELRRILVLRVVVANFGKPNKKAAYRF